MTYWNRPKEERDLIQKAYSAEVELIEADSTETNPYHTQIMALSDGAELWAGINFALELKYNSAEE